MGTRWVLYWAWLWDAKRSIPSLFKTTSAQCQEKQDIIQYFCCSFTFSLDKEPISYFLHLVWPASLLCCINGMQLLFKSTQPGRVGTPKIRWFCLGQKTGMSWFYWHLCPDWRPECQKCIEAWSHVLISCSVSSPFKKAANWIQLPGVIRYFIGLPRGQPTWTAPLGSLLAFCNNITT